MLQTNTIKLSQQEFLGSFEKVPRAAVSLAIINEKNEILLTKRREDPFKDFWHLPGSFISKNESIKNCIQRVLIEELDFKNDINFELIFLSENIDKDPRGHVLDLIYKIMVNSDALFMSVGRTKELKYFDKIPTDVGFNHADVLKKLGFYI